MENKGYNRYIQNKEKNMKITGTLKNYADLLTAYGYTPTSGPLDEQFDSFLKRIQGKDCYLGNYNPWSKTFDLSLIEPDPDRPGVNVMTMLNGIEKRYGDNMGIDKLAIINQVDTADYIWCTTCGFNAAKNTRYDYEPTYTYGDMFNNDLITAQGVRGTKTLTKTLLKASAPANKIYCPKCRKLSTFKTVQDSFI